MSRSVCLAMLMAAELIAAQTTPSITPRVAWVQVVDGSGNNRSGFVPDAVPPSNPGETRPSTIVFVNQPSARTPQGQIITGFAFEAWRVKDAIRVVVYSMVPRPGEPNVNMVPKFGDPLDLGKLRKQEVIDVTLKVGETRKVVEMAALGVDPMTIRVDPTLPGT